MGDMRLKNMEARERNFEEGWYVLKTNRNKELFVTKRLSDFQISSYFPLLYVDSPPRRTKVIIPLFSMYVFVALRDPRQFYKARYLQGVNSLMPLGTQPVPIEEDIILFLKMCEKKDGFMHIDSLPLTRRLFSEKEWYESLCPIIQNPSSNKHRVNVLYTFFD